jgi:hypothetical protein
MNATGGGSGGGGNMKHPLREALLAMALATLVVVWPLLLPVLYDTHDGHYALYNAAQFDLALRDGQLPVRWLPDLFGGRGLPHFIFYHPLVFYLVSLVHGLGFGFMAAMRLVQMLALLAAGMAAWAWLRRYVPHPAAVVGGMAYVLAPMAVVELHVKGDPPAVLALTFIPLVLLAMERVKEQRRYGVLLLALTSAGLVLAHSVTALLVAPLLTVAGIMAMAWPWRWPVAWRLAVGTLWGACLSIFQWLPALGERHLVRVDSREGILFFDFHDHFLAPWQWLSPLWGYHGSFAGSEDDMAFQVGPVQVLALVAAALLVRRMDAGRPRRLLAVMLSLAGLALLLTTTLTLPVWEGIAPLTYVQFPWRFLVLVAFTSASALAVVLSLDAPRKRVVAGALAAPAALALLFAAIQGNLWYALLGGFYLLAGSATAGVWFRSRKDLRAASVSVAVMLMVAALPWTAVPLHARLKNEPAVILLSESDLRPARVRLGIRRTTARDDYLPLTVSVVPPRDASQEYLPPPAARAPVMAEIIRGEGQVGIIRRHSTGLAVQVDAGSACLLRLNLHDFAGMTVRSLAAGEMTVLPHDHDDQGRVQVELLPGRHQLEARLERSEIRRVSDGLALAAWLLLPGVGLITAFRGRSRYPTAHSSPH